MAPGANINTDLPKASELEAFVAYVWDKGREHERAGLPWRHIDDAYGVWVSEVMLQQTQVSRVLDYWPRWMKRYPTLDALASAAASDVLESWQGLGYNRRALAMKKAADYCSQHCEGALPLTFDGLVQLPGIGPATAAGIVAFAYQRPAVYLETNVRAVYLHHFFAGQDQVPDARIAPLVEQTCSAEDPRGWYYSLLDYGHYLKKTASNPTRRSASYTRQSKFEGSWRQKRSMLVREVLGSPGLGVQEARDALDAHERSAGRDTLDADDFERLVTELEAEGFFSRVGDTLVP